MNSEFDHLTEVGLMDLSEVIIRDAIQCAMGIRCMAESDGRRRKVNPEACREAWLWFESDDEMSPFSFINCALNIGINPFPFREKLKKEWTVIRQQSENQKLYDKLFVSPIKTREQAHQLFNAAPEPIWGEVVSGKQFALAL